MSTWILIATVMIGGVLQQDVKPQFSTTVSLMAGTWLLDEQLSQDPREAMRDAMRGGRGGMRMGIGGRPGGGGGGGGGGGRPGGGGGGGRPGGGGGGGRPGGGGGGGRPGGGGGGRPDPGAGGGPGLGWAASKEIEITSKDPGLMMANETGLLRYVLADGLWVERKLPDGSRAEIKSEWADGKLKITTAVDRGFKTTETWEVLPEADRLVLILQIESPRLDDPISIRRVFDKAAEPVTDGR